MEKVSDINQENPQENVEPISSLDSSGVFIECQKDALLKPLQIVGGVIDKKAPKQILANILFKKEGQSVRFIANDADIQITTTAPIGYGDSNFDITISARKLTDIISSLNDNSTLTISEKKGHVLVNSGKSKFDLQTLPADQYPCMADNEGFVHAFSMPCMRFKYLLNMVAFAAATNNVRYFLNGVYICAQDNFVRTVATDGHRMALCEVEQEEPSSQEKHAIIPRKTVRELIRLIPDSEEILSVDISERQLKVRFGTVELLSKLVEGTYPDYNRVIPVANDKEFLVNREELHSALQRVSILTVDKLKGVRWSLSEGTLKVAYTSADMEEAEDEIKIEYSGEPMEIGFNVGYLMDILNILKNETVRFSLGGPLSSALVRMPDSENFKFVVMPMKI